MADEVKALTPTVRDDCRAKIVAQGRVIENLRQRIERLESQVRRTGATPIR